MSFPSLKSLLPRSAEGTVDRVSEDQKLKEPVPVGMKFEIPSYLQYVADMMEKEAGKSIFDMSNEEFRNTIGTIVGKKREAETDNPKDKDEYLNLVMDSMALSHIANSARLRGHAVADVYRPRSGRPA